MLGVQSASIKSLLQKVPTFFHFFAESFPYNIKLFQLVNQYFQ